MLNKQSHTTLPAQAAIARRWLNIRVMWWCWAVLPWQQMFSRHITPTCYNIVMRSQCKSGNNYMSNKFIPCVWERSKTSFNSCQLQKSEPRTGVLAIDYRCTDSKNFAGDDSLISNILALHITLLEKLHSTANLIYFLILPISFCMSKYIFVHLTFVRVKTYLYSKPFNYKNL